MPLGARVLAPRVKVGDVVVVTAAAQVQPVCLDIAIVHRQTPSGLEKVGTLSTNGGWQDQGTGPTPTFPACLPPEALRPPPIWSP